MAQQVETQAKAELATFQEQARQQVASKITVIEQKEEENRQIKLAAELRESNLLKEGQELQGRTAGLVQQQQLDQAFITRQTQLLQEKEAHTNDIQAKLDHLQAQHLCTIAAQGGEQEIAQARIDAQLIEYESTIRGRVNQEAMAEQQRIQQVAQQQVDILNQQAIDATQALALHQEESRKLLEQRDRLSECARLRECENEHLRSRLSVAEELAKAAQPPVEAQAVQATQVDAPTPPDSSQGTDLTGALEAQVSPFLTVQDPPDLGPELLSQPEADNEALSPAKKRPSTQSPSPAAALADHAYPPSFHGATGSQPSPSPPSCRRQDGTWCLVTN